MKENPKGGRLRSVALGYLEGLPSVAAARGVGRGPPSLIRVLSGAVEKSTLPASLPPPTWKATHGPHPYQKTCAAIFSWPFTSADLHLLQSSWRGYSDRHNRGPRSFNTTTIPAVAEATATRTWALAQPVSVEGGGEHQHQHQSSALSDRAADAALLLPPCRLLRQSQTAS